MLVGDRHYRSIWRSEDGAAAEIIDQTVLPHELAVKRLGTVEEVAEAISVMRVRGAPLIGVTAAYGMAMACDRDPGDGALQLARDKLFNTRPTAVNLAWALERMTGALWPLPDPDRGKAAWLLADQMAEEDVDRNRRIGENGLGVLRAMASGQERPLQILTHCNAGWLATVDWGTALAPIFAAHDAGIEVHVWVDETRPRNQGARLTAWELMQHGVPCTVIVDNVGGHLMQHGMVDVCIVGSDRTSRNGDVANKIGTYLKALAAHDNEVPFYVALPSSTIDWRIEDGVRDIPIEERDPGEVHEVGLVAPKARITPVGAAAKNYGFDVTPARLVTGLITERGVCNSTQSGIAELFPELAESP